MPKKGVDLDGFPIYGELGKKEGVVFFSGQGRGDDTPMRTMDPMKHL